MKVKIKHEDLGEIVIHSELPKEVNDIIGTVVGDYYKYKFYHATIEEDENNRFIIRHLHIITPKIINVGSISTSCGGSKNFVNIMHNVYLLEHLIIYPLGILYVEK